MQQKLLKNTLNAHKSHSKPLIRGSVWSSTTSLLRYREDPSLFFCFFKAALWYGSILSTNLPDILALIFTNVGLFDDMYQNGTFNSTAEKYCSMCYVHILVVPALRLVETKYIISAILRSAAKYRHKQLSNRVCTAARNKCYYRITSIPSVLYAAYRGSSINKSSHRTEHPVELIYRYSERTCTNI